MSRRTCLGLLLAAVMLGAGVSTSAAAGTPVKQAIEAQLKRIQANPGFRSLKTFKVRNTTEAKAAIPKLDALEGLLTSAAVAVQKASATTSAERTGKTEWIAAVKLNVRGVSDLTVGLRDYVKGNKTEAQTEIDKGVKLDASANEESIKAYKVLGIPVSS